MSEEVKADVILMGHTAIGKDVAPRVAARLDSGMVSDCTAVELLKKKILFSLVQFMPVKHSKRRKSRTGKSICNHSSK